MTFDVRQPAAAGCRARSCRELHGAAGQARQRRERVGGGRRGQRLGVDAAQPGQRRRRCAAARPGRCASSPRRPAPRRCGRAIAAGCPGRRSPCTIASSGTAAATRRIRSARSKVSAPPKPSLKPSSTKAAGLLLAAVEGVGDAAAHRPCAQLLEHAVDRPAHVQQHRQLELARQLRAGRRRSRPGARGRGPATKWSRPISPTATSRGSSRCASSASRSAARSASPAAPVHIGWMPSA